MAAVWAVCPVVAGCQLEAQEPGGDEREEISSVSEEISSANALNKNALVLNALNVNALNGNALNGNALNGNALNGNALSPVQAAGPEGDLAREAVRYMASCALASDDSVSFSWTDADGIVHDETYPGLMGLAPEWSTRALTEQESRWVSACLASRVNWYQVSVQLSSRGSLQALKHASGEELATYTRREGAFWGNLFSTTPVIHACFAASGVAYSRAQQRDCAAGHVDADGQVTECGIIDIVGACEDVCQKTQPHFGYHSRCSAGDGDAWNEVVTVFLQ